MNYIAVNFKVFPDNHLMITNYRTTTNNYKIGSPDMNVDKETKKVHGRFSNEFNRVNRELGIGVIDYLKNLGYKFKTEMNEGVEQNILYFNNEPDLYQLIDDLKKYKNKNVSEKLKHVKLFEEYTMKIRK